MSKRISFGDQARKMIRDCELRSGIDRDPEMVDMIKLSALLDDKCAINNKIGRLLMGISARASRIRMIGR